MPNLILAASPREWQQVLYREKQFAGEFMLVGITLE
jgi:hypothetical protein